MVSIKPAAEETKTTPSLKTIEGLLLKHNIKLDSDIFIEEWPDGIFIRKKKATIWDFAGKIKAEGSVEEERESMLDAAVAHAMGDSEIDVR